MYDREKTEKTENIREKKSSRKNIWLSDMYDREEQRKQKILGKKYHLGVFLSLTMGGGNCGPKWR